MRYKLIFVTSNIIFANVLHSEEANMGTQTIIILMLMTFIIGLVVGMILAVELLVEIQPYMEM